jgi:putative SOS response-associated peptidase YedK
MRASLDKPGIFPARAATIVADSKFIAAVNSGSSIICATGWYPNGATYMTMNKKWLRSSAACTASISG